jgi:hypothetical protein
MNATDQFLPKCSIISTSEPRALTHMLTYTHIVISRRVVSAMRQETALAPRLQNAAAAAQSRIAFSAIEPSESGQKASHATTFQHLFNPGAHAGILYLSLKQSCHSISCFEPVCMCVCVMSDCVGRALRRSNNSQQLARHIRIDLLRPLSLTSLASSLACSRALCPAPPNSLSPSAGPRPLCA